MLRRMSLTGDAMAHAILPGAALGYLVAGLSVEAMTIGGLLAGGLVVILPVLSPDSPKAVKTAPRPLLSYLDGTRVMIISVHGSSVDLPHVLFGSALASTIRHCGCWACYLTDFSAVGHFIAHCDGMPRPRFSR